MLAHEREFFDTLKSEQAKTAYKAMLQDCNDAIRGINDERLRHTDPHAVISTVVEMEKSRSRLRQDAMMSAVHIDAEMIRVKADIMLTGAHMSNQ